jgi:hypothetical protein
MSSHYPFWRNISFYTEQTAVPPYPRGIVSRIILGYQKPGMLRSLYKMHITYVPPSPYIKLALDDLQYLIQCKCYVNSCYTALVRD